MADLQQATTRQLARIAEKKINRIHGNPVSHDNHQHHGRAVEAATGFLERAIAALEQKQRADPEKIKKAESMLQRAIQRFTASPEYDEAGETPLNDVSDFLETADVSKFLPENNPGSPPLKACG